MSTTFVLTCMQTCEEPHDICLSALRVAPTEIADQATICVVGVSCYISGCGGVNVCVLVMYGLVLSDAVLYCRSSLVLCYIVLSCLVWSGLALSCL